MQRWRKRQIAGKGTGYARLGCGLLLAAAAAWGGAQGIFEDLRMPLEHYPDGQRRSELMARVATVRPDGRIEATGVVIRFYRPDGTVESVIEADACTSDRAARTAESGAPVRVTRPGLQLTGVGFLWDADADQLHIRSNARLEFSREALEAERGRRQGAGGAGEAE